MHSTRHLRSSSQTRMNTWPLVRLQTLQGSPCCKHGASGCQEEVSWVGLKSFRCSGSSGSIEHSGYVLTFWPLLIISRRWTTSSSSQAAERKCSWSTTRELLAARWWEADREKNVELNRCWFGLLLILFVYFLLFAMHVWPDVCTGETCMQARCRG